MIDLIDKRTTRILNIAEALTFTTDSVTFEDFKAMNNCSLKTVYNDINFLVQNYNQLLEIEVRNISAISHCSSADNFLTVRADLYHAEPKIIFLLNLYFFPENDLFDHSLQLNYSESYLRTLLREINLFLSKLDISIKYDNENRLYYFHSNTKYAVEHFIIDIVQMCDCQQHMRTLLGRKKPFAFDKLTFPDFEYNDEEKILRENFLLILSNSLSEEDINQYIDNTHKLNNRLTKEIRPILIESLTNSLAVHSISLTEESFSGLTSMLLKTIQKCIVVPKKRLQSITRLGYFELALRKRSNEKVLLYEDIADAIQKALHIDISNFRSEFLFYLHQVINITCVSKVHTIAVYSHLGKSHRDNLIFSINKAFSKQNVVEYNEQDEDTYDLIVGVPSHSKFVHNEDHFIAISDIPTHIDHENIAKKLFRR